MSCLHRLQLALILCFGCCLHLVSAARVYMEFNGHRYEYNTDGLADSQALSPNYERLESQHWPYTTTGNVSPRISNSYTQQWGWTQPQQVPSSAPPTSVHQPSYNINLNTPQMTHTQHTDAAGHVLGKYSYYDNAGYHELSYKAGAGIGFVVMGGNLAKPTQSLH